MPPSVNARALQAAQARAARRGKAGDGGTQDSSAQQATAAADSDTACVLPVSADATTASPPTSSPSADLWTASASPVSLSSPSLSPSLAPSSSVTSLAPPRSDGCVQCGTSGSLHFEQSVDARVCMECGHAESRLEALASASSSGTVALSGSDWTPNAGAGEGAAGNLVAETHWDADAGRHERTSTFVANDSIRYPLSQSAAAFKPVGLVSAAAVGDPLHRAVRGRQRVSQQVSILMHKLRIPGNVKAQVCNMVERTAEIKGAMRAGSTCGSSAAHFVDGRTGELLVGSCVYALCRQRGLAISMLDVSDALECNVFVFGRTFLRVCSTLQLHLHDLDPSLFVERLLTGVHDAEESADFCGMEGMATAPVPLSDEVRLRARREANTLLKLARRDWLLPGRTPAALAGAAVHLALVSAGASFPLRSLAAQLKIGERTLSLRVRELKASLLLVMQQTLPSMLPPTPPTGGSRGSRAVEAHLPFVMDNLALLMQVQDEARSQQEQADANLEQQGVAGMASPAMSPSSSGCDTLFSLPSSSPPAVISYASAALDPPSFQRLCTLRRARLIRILCVVHRAEASGRLPLTDVPLLLREARSAGLLAPTAIQEGSEEELGRALPSILSLHASEPCDDEEAQLESLMLAGVPLAQLLEQPLSQLSAAASSASAFAPASALPLSGPLSDLDVSPSELSLYTRTEAEAQQMARLIAHQAALMESAEGPAATKRALSPDAAPTAASSPTPPSSVWPAGCREDGVRLAEHPPKRARVACG